MRHPTEDRDLTVDEAAYVTRRTRKLRAIRAGHAATARRRERQKRMAAWYARARPKLDRAAIAWTVCVTIPSLLLLILLAVLL